MLAMSAIPTITTIESKMSPASRSIDGLSSSLLGAATTFGRSHPVVGIFTGSLWILTVEHDAIDSPPDDLCVRLSEIDRPARDGGLPLNMSRRMSTALVVIPCIAASNIATGRFLDLLSD